MVRRIASQVHKQAARLMRADFIKQEPVWYRAVLDHPPLPLPPKASPLRPDHEARLERRKLGPDAKLPPPKNNPLPIRYLEDEIRRQFFRDHPFETFRPISLVESGAIEDDNAVRGKTWTRLSKRGRNPTPEDAIHFAVNLHKYHGVSLSNAYAMSVAQFRSLRSEYEVASAFAVMEAQAYGATFGQSEVERIFEREKEQLGSSQRKDELDQGAMIARKRWRAILDVQSGIGSFDSWGKGQTYMSLWDKGARPTYAAAVTGPAEPATGADSAAINIDFMGVRPTSS